MTDNPSYLGNYVTADTERTTMSISVLRLEYRGEHDQDDDQPVAQGKSARRTDFGPNRRKSFHKTSTLRGDLRHSKPALPGTSA